VRLPKIASAPADCQGEASISPSSTMPSWPGGGVQIPCLGNHAVRCRGPEGPVHLVKTYVSSLQTCFTQCLCAEGRVSRPRGGPGAGPRPWPGPALTPSPRQGCSSGPTRSVASRRRIPSNFSRQVLAFRHRLLPGPFPGEGVGAVGPPPAARLGGRRGGETAGGAGEGGQPWTGPHGGGRRPGQPHYAAPARPL
jgi:hypothetical protein